MQLVRKATIVFLLALLVVLWFGSTCFANMLPVDEDLTTAILRLLGIELLIAFALTALIESLVVCVVLWQRWGHWWRIIGAVALVNLITFPPTQIAWFAVNGLLLGHPLASGAVISTALLELLVALAEFFLLRWRLGRLCQRGFLDKSVSKGRLIAATAGANAASFAVGFVVAEAGTPFRFLPFLL